MVIKKINKILLHSPGAKKNHKSGIYQRFVSAKKLLNDNGFIVFDDLNFKNFIHSELILTDSMVAYTLLFLIHKKCYFQMHDLREFENLNYSRYRYKRLMFFIKKLFFSYAKIVTISKFSNDEYQKYIGKTAHAILPNFIYPEPNKIAKPHNRKLLIYNDTLPHKGPDVISNLINSMSNLEAITPTTDITSAQFIIVPSIYEGFGFVPLQFALYGVKPIVSNIPPHKEIHNDIAVLCDDFSKENLEEIVEQNQNEKPVKISQKASFLNKKLQVDFLRGIRELIDGKS